MSGVTMQTSVSGSGRGDGQRVELGRGTLADEMRERVHAERGDVGLLLQVEGRLEERMRIAALGGSVAEVVDERIDVGGDVRVPLAVEGRVEQAALRDQRDILVDREGGWSRFCRCDEGPARARAEAQGGVLETPHRRGDLPGGRLVQLAHRGFLAHDL